MVSCHGICHEMCYLPHCVKTGQHGTDETIATPTKAVCSRLSWLVPPERERVGCPVEPLVDVAREPSASESTSSALRILSPGSFSAILANFRLSMSIASSSLWRQVRKPAAIPQGPYASRIFTTGRMRAYRHKRHYTPINRKSQVER